MALVLPLDGLTPQLGRGVWLAPNATLVGDVELGDGASVWFGAVLRGDMGRIRIGARTNVQDLTMVHMTTGKTDARVGDDCTIGHSVILHGCTIGDRCLIGMGAIVMDHATIGDEAVIAAGALVTPRTVVPPRSLVMGSPAKVVRQATPEEIALGIDGARHYLDAARRYRDVR